MIIEWSRPVDIHYLSNRLYLYQFAIALTLAPVIYLLQGDLAAWHGMHLTVENITRESFCILLQCLPYASLFYRVILVAAR